MNTVILALQGDYESHKNAVLAHFPQSKIIFLRQKNDIPDHFHPDLFIIPGGESSAMSILIEAGQLSETIDHLMNHPQTVVLTTCAGTIMLANKVTNPGLAVNIPKIGITVERNAYGRQTDSRIGVLKLTDNGRRLAPHSPRFNDECVFIRAPKITHIHPNTEVLAYEQDSPVFVRDGRFLAATFHPELSANSLIYEIVKNLLYNHS